MSQWYLLYMFKHACSYKLPTTPICEMTNYIVNIAIDSQWFITSSPGSDCHIICPTYNLNVYM